MIEVRIENNRIIVDTDDPGFGGLFKYKAKENKYDYYKKIFKSVEVSKSIYDQCNKIGLGWRYKFKIGWGVLIINMYKDKLGVDNINTIAKTIYSESYRVAPFDNL